MAGEQEQATAPRAGARRFFVSTRAMIMLGVLAIAVVTLAGPLRELVHQQDQLETLARQSAANEKRVAELQHQLELWNDPDYIGEQARSRLHFLLPGEVGYTVIGDVPREPGPDLRMTQQYEKGPWFTELWRSIGNAGRDANYGDHSVRVGPNSPR